MIENTREIVERSEDVDHEIRRWTEKISVYIHDAVPQERPRF